MLKKILIVMAVISVIAMFFLSCSSEENPAGRLAGTWTVTMTPTSGTDHGQGTFTITYLDVVDLGSLKLYAYSGTGTLNGQPFYILVNESVPEFMGYNFFLDFRRDSLNDMDNMLACGGTLSGNTATGEYYGEPLYAYDGDEGSFTATRQ